MNKDLSWLLENGFSKVGHELLSARAGKNYMDGDWIKVITDLARKPVCHLTYFLERNCFEVEVYVEELANWLNHEMLTVTAFTAEEAYTKAVNRWLEFANKWNS